MLIALMYHRIGTGKHANTLPMLRSHLLYLKERYPIVLPGDFLQKGKLSICLTFDDATFDFYHYVFPLLQELKLRAVLGVPVRYIMDTNILPPEERLAIPYPLMMQDGFFDKKVPFCTWEELSEMVLSGHVEVASHSFSHANLTFPFVNLQREIHFSKEILEQKLPQAVSTFIYPFGRFTPAVQEAVSATYPYVFRIGSALNKGWHKKTPLCRIPADCLISPSSLLSVLKLCRYYLKSKFS